MRRAVLLITLEGIIFFLLALSTSIKPQLLYSLMSILVFVLLALTLLYTAVLGFMVWRNISRLWMTPALLCLAFMLSAWCTPPLGRIIADWQFRRHMNEYDEFVARFRKGPIPKGCDTRLGAIDVKHLPHHTRVVLAACCSDGSVVVGFLSDTDVPLLHEGYVFKGYGERNSCVADSMKPENKWPYVRPVTGKWYHFSDKPGR
jgi:hypothetical protein